MSIDLLTNEYVIFINCRNVLLWANRETYKKIVDTKVQRIFFLAFLATFADMCLRHVHLMLGFRCVVFVRQKLMNWHNLLSQQVFMKWAWNNYKNGILLPPPSFLKFIFSGLSSKTLLNFKNKYSKMTGKCWSGVGGWAGQRDLQTYLLKWYLLKKKNPSSVQKPFKPAVSRIRVEAEKEMLCHSSSFKTNVAPRASYRPNNFKYSNLYCLQDLTV